MLVRHISRLAAVLLISGWLPIWSADPSKLPPAADSKIDFMRDVDPIFQQHCYMCHGDQVVMNGYSLWRKKSAVRGGYSGKPAIVERDSANSRLIHLVAGLEENLVMPPTGGQLTTAQIGILRAWIDQGTPFASTRFDDSTKRAEQPWLHMDYGPVISASVTVREPEDPRADKEPGDNVSYKSHLIMLADERKAGVVFDHRTPAHGGRLERRPIRPDRDSLRLEARAASVSRRHAGLRDAGGSGMGSRR